MASAGELSSELIADRFTMRRRTQIVLAITFMVAALVSGASYLYISQILRQGINTAHDTAAYLTLQLAFLASNAAPDLSSTRIDTNNPEALRRGISYYLGTDRDLNTMLESVVGSWPTIYDAAILDADGKALLDTDSQLVGKKIEDRPDFSTLQNAGFRRKLRLVYHAPTVYDVHIPLHAEWPGLWQYSRGCLDRVLAERPHAALAACLDAFSNLRSVLADAGGLAIAHSSGAPRTHQS